MQSVLWAYFEILKFYLRSTHTEMDGRMCGGAAATVLVVVNRKLKERIEAVSYI